jgi:hypothetical protein
MEDDEEGYVPRRNDRGGWRRTVEAGDDSDDEEEGVHRDNDDADSLDASDNMLDEWPSMDAARKDIKSFLQCRNIPSRTLQSAPHRYELVCPRTKMDPPVQCSFNIAAWRYERSQGAVRIYKLCLDHSCGCMLEGGAHSNVRYSSKWAGTQTTGLILDTRRQAKPAHMQESLRRRLGADVSYMTVWRGREHVRELQTTDDIKAFQLIQPYFSKLEEKMPGTRTAFERDTEDRLLRTFVLLKPLADALLYCRPVLSFDACGLLGRYKGVVMSATAVDGEGQLLLLAWGTAPIENGDHWDWFAENLWNGLPDQQRRQRYTILSDREKGIERALETHFSHCFHAFCVKHIEKNVVVRCDKVRKSTKVLMWNASKALRYSKYVEYMARIREENVGVYEYLQQIPPERWTTCHATLPKWGHVTSNASESMNNWMGEFRDKSHIGLHSGLVRKCMQNLYDRRTTYSRVNTMFPKATTKKLNNIMTIGRTLHVFKSTDNWFEVDGEFEVHLGDEPSCTCRKHIQFRLPCKHMAAAVASLDPRNTNIHDDLRRYVDARYSTESLRAVYASIIPPCSIADLVPDQVTLPQGQRMQSGRPKETRMRGENESNPEESRITCSKCRGRGHNSRTCEKRQANRGRATHRRGANREGGRGGPRGQGGRAGRGRGRGGRGRGLEGGNGRAGLQPE